MIAFAATVVGRSAHAHAWPTRRRCGVTGRRGITAAAATGPAPPELSQHRLRYGSHVTRKDLILGTIDGMVVDFLYYDRKEDEDLPLGSIEEAVASGQVTVAEMVTQFRSALVQGLE